MTGTVLPIACEPGIDVLHSEGVKEGSNKDLEEGGGATSELEPGTEANVARGVRASSGTRGTGCEMRRHPRTMS